MEFLLLLISASCLLVGVVGSQATLPSALYWKSELPDTPMPTIVYDLLHPDQEGKPLTDRARSANSYNTYARKPLTGIAGSRARSSNNYNTYARKPLTGVAGSRARSSNNYNTYTHKHKNTISQPLNLDKYPTNPPLGKSTIPLYTRNTIPNQVDIAFGKNTVTDTDSTLTDLYDVKSNLNDNAPTNRQLQDDPGASLFFLEEDLHSGAKMNLHFFLSTASGTTFLSQKLAQVTPFSTDKLPEILNQFAINPESEEAESVNETIADCEGPATENEEKYCATSLESLVEFGTSKFGKNVNVLTTVIACDKAKRTRMRKQAYVVSGVRQIVSDNLVACHSLPYLYAVFYCHATPPHSTRAYVVPLVGADGTKIKATAVCHKDTSKWDPDHVAFQVLKVKPGGVPICHFLNEDNIVWAAKNNDI